MHDSLPPNPKDQRSLLILRRLLEEARMVYRKLGSPLFVVAQKVLDNVIGHGGGSVERARGVKVYIAQYRTWVRIRCKPTSRSCQSTEWRTLSRFGQSDGKSRKHSLRKPHLRELYSLSNQVKSLQDGKRLGSRLLSLKDRVLTIFRSIRLVHGSLARAGKVRSQTPKVDKQEKKKKPTGRAKKRILYNRR
jgi:small subunit ribosomal protein S30e